jgi:hypothetical protein
VPFGLVSNDNDIDDECTSNIFDCNDDCNGEADFDNCGNCVYQDNFNGAQDCAGVCNGLSVYDNCGTCDAEPSNDCEVDCTGTWGGTSIIDNCGNCRDDVDLDVNENDPTYGSSPLCSQACDGNWYDSSDAAVPIEDECGICDGNNNFMREISQGVYVPCSQGEENCFLPNGHCSCDGDTQDCDGICGGGDLSCYCTPELEWAGHDDCRNYSENECGIQIDCQWHDPSENDAVDIAGCYDKSGYDCLGICGGSSMEDKCGVCNGNDECLDCGGKPNGGAFLNACGNCECGIDGQVLNNLNDAADACVMPEFSLYVTYDGKVLFNSGDMEFLGVSFNVEGVELGNNVVIGGDAYDENWSFHSGTELDFLAYGSLNNDGTMNTISGCGILFELDISSGKPLSLTDIIVSDPMGSSPGLAFEYYASECIMDDVCDYDCAGILNGNRELDECGRCREPDSSSSLLPFNMPAQS